MVVFIDKEYSYCKNTLGDEAVKAERHLSFCTWTLVSVNPEMLVGNPSYRKNTYFCRVVV